MTNYYLRGGKKSGVLITKKLQVADFAERAGKLLNAGTYSAGAKSQTVAEVQLQWKIVKLRNSRLETHCIL